MSNNRNQSLEDCCFGSQRSKKDNNIDLDATVAADILIFMSKEVLDLEDAISLNRHIMKHRCSDAPPSNRQMLEEKKPDLTSLNNHLSLDSEYTRRSTYRCIPETPTTSEQVSYIKEATTLNRRVLKHRRQRHSSFNDQKLARPYPTSLNNHLSKKKCMTGLRHTCIFEHPTESIPALRGFIGRQCSPAFVKRLTESDVKDSQSRLPIQRDFVESYIDPMLKEGENISNGIAVTTYDRDGNSFNMSYKGWMNVNVLISGWKTFYKEHRLQANVDVISLWAFRHAQTDDLCFAITWNRHKL